VARLTRQLIADESGITLVLALVVMMVMSVVAMTALQVSASSARQSKRVNAAEKAYAFAEAGLNNAAALISQSKADTSAIRPAPGYAGDLGSTVTQLPGGTVTWGGTFDAATKTWTIKAIGSVPNPTGPTASPVTRTLKTAITLVPPAITFAALNKSSDNHTLILRANASLEVTNAIYVNSSNDHDGFDIKGTTGSITAPAMDTTGGWEFEISGSMAV